MLEALFRNEAWGFMLQPVSQENEKALCQSMVDGCRCRHKDIICRIYVLRLRVLPMFGRMVEQPAVHLCALPRGTGKR